jgi:hypothetical protein
MQQIDRGASERSQHFNRSRSWFDRRDRFSLAFARHRFPQRLSLALHTSVTTQAARHRAKTYLLECNPRRTLALKRAPATSHCPIRQRVATPGRSLERAAEVAHRLQPAVAVQPQPIEDRRKPAANRLATYRTQLAPRPIQQRQKFLKLDRQKASSRCAGPNLRPRTTRACFRRPGSPD